VSGALSCRTSKHVELHQTWINFTRHCFFFFAGVLELVWKG